MYPMPEGPYRNHQGAEIDLPTFEAVRLLKRLAHELFKEHKGALSPTQNSYYGAMKCHTACFHLLGLKP